MPLRLSHFFLVIASLLIALAVPVWGEDAEENLLSSEALQIAFDKSVQPLLRDHCVKCHGKSEKIAGEINLLELTSAEHLLAKPELLKDMVEAVDSEYMPPEEEASLSAGDRTKLVESLQSLFQHAVALQKTPPHVPLRRMTRLQYNNAVTDLFDLKVVVFPLPERMMREHGNYFQPQTGKMPKTVQVGSRVLGKSQLIEPRLAGVSAFPQDLRAEHGFDNQGDHLSLSPLLLESFLKLSRSIVESNDFNPRNVGIWPQFFAPPKEFETVEAKEAEVRRRLSIFLTRAFRRPVEDEVLDRYVGYVKSQIESGETFVDAMKSVAAATIASPRFFYLYDASGEATKDSQPDNFNLASRLSFFLWGSIPDQQLLDAATNGTLHQPDVLAAQVDRMLNDRKLKRFCDSFPAQWLQLERIISSTPDEESHPQFYFLKYRVSMHMMLEPLLLFETVLIEDRPILDLIDPDFSYRSDTLKAWYRDGKQGNPGSPVVVKFDRVPVEDRRQGGVITNAAVMTMTSGPRRTQPITRGAWMLTVILNDPPEPPPADVPPLAEKPSVDEENLTIRERFAAHRTRPDCAACHKRLDPLGFALENFDQAGIWRDKYANGREVDASGELFGKHAFQDVVTFKDVLLLEKDRFARAFASHLLAYSLGREVTVADAASLDNIVSQSAAADYKFRTMIKQVVLSDSFRNANTANTAPADQNEAAADSGNKEVKSNHE